MSADVIISAFATPPQEKYRLLAQDPSFFNDEPVIVGVNPEMAAGEVLASPGFARTANRLKALGGGSILKPLLRKLSGYEIRSVTLVGFSAGNTFLAKVLATDDWRWVDGVVCLDGLTVQKLWDGSWHGPSLEPWARFADDAARDRRLFINAYTHIASHSKQVGSTRESAEAVMDVVSDRVFGVIPNPRYDMARLTMGPPPPEVTIKAQRGTETISKTWTTMPQPGITAIGNCWNLDYGGNAEPDHIFMSRYVQRAIWHTFLAQRFNEGVHCSLTDLPVAGLGAECAPNKVEVPPGVFPTAPMWPGLTAAGLGLALGTAVGYWAGRRLGE